MKKSVRIFSLRVLTYFLCLHSSPFPTSLRKHFHRVACDEYRNYFRSRRERHPYKKLLRSILIYFFIGKYVLFFNVDQSLFHLAKRTLSASPPHFHLAKRTLSSCEAPKAQRKKSEATMWINHSFILRSALFHLTE